MLNPDHLPCENKQREFAVICLFCHWIASFVNIIHCSCLLIWAKKSVILVGTIVVIYAAENLTENYVIFSSILFWLNLPLLIQRIKCYVFVSPQGPVEAHGHLKSSLSLSSNSRLLFSVKSIQTLLSHLPSIGNSSNIKTSTIQGIESIF